MKWQEFHHPDISLPVVRRRLGMELMEMLELASVFLTRGGWGVLYRSCYPDQQAYRRAAGRLEKNGLVVGRSVRGEVPRIALSDSGRQALPDYFNPDMFWNKRWNGFWYLFVYDVPEKNRSYRDVLRRFLKRMRLGCLQQSVWVTPTDIRPEFDDLVKGAGVDSFAYLFESKTVLRLPNRRVVDDAWDLERLYEIQSRFCVVTEQNLDLLLSGNFDPDALASLLRTSLTAYHAAFTEDPLLPRKLLPPDYLGEKAYALHCRLFKEMNKKL